MDKQIREKCIKGLEKIKNIMEVIKDDPINNTTQSNINLIHKHSSKLELLLYNEVRNGKR